MRLLQRITIVLFVLTVVAFGFFRYMNSRAEDVTVPVITADSDVISVSVTASEEELLSGLTAYDEKDGDLTFRIQIDRISKFISEGECNITYTVCDYNNNVAKYTRRLVYTDYTEPIFNITTNLTFSVGSSTPLVSYITAYDVLDGDISDKVKIVSSNLSTAQEGVYMVTAQATNSRGDVVYLEFPVSVIASVAQVPTVRLTQYVVYLKAGEAFDERAYIRSVLDTTREELSLDTVTVQSDYDGRTAGSYTVIYSAINERGMIGSARLTLMVTP
ncbi:MAG: hypothetical protein Q4C01_06360 [Clostridia bacterium]|nr:hypothetical protein [Clostridia bacterium]